MDEVNDAWSAGVGSSYFRGVFLLPFKDLLSNLPEKGLSGEQRKMLPVDYVDAPSKLKSTSVQHAAAGGTFNVFVRTDGKVFVDGPDSLSSAVSLGSSLSKEVQGLQLENAVCGVAAGLYHVVIWSKTELITWGFNVSAASGGIVRSIKFGDVCGQLGRGLEAKSMAPGKVKMPPNCEMLFVACGASHTLVLTDQGLFGFGLNRENQVSDSPDEAIGVPCSILVRERVRTVACGTHHSLAACTTGSVYAWGLNERGQCVPSAKTAVVPTPTQVVFRDNDRAVAVAAGSHHSLALTADGSVLSWGSNSHGQLGRKETQKNFRIDIDVPCKAVACGSLFSCAISNTGRVRVWGALQDPSLAGVQPIPRPIPHLEGEVVLRVSCGATHQLITFAEERELPVMKDFCYREQDAAKVASILSQLDQKVPAGFGQHQNAAHRLMHADKTTRRASVFADEAVLSWNTSSATSFVVPFHSLGQKPVHADAQFVFAAGTANKINVELELSPSAQFGKQPLLLRIRCNYVAAVSPMVLLLGAVLVTFTKDKDFKAKKPSSSFLVLLCRSTVNASSRSFLSLPSQAPPTIQVDPLPLQSGTSSPASSAASSAPSSARSEPGSKSATGALPSLGLSTPASGNASQTSSPRSARVSESGGMQNPILSLVHLNKRELTRKCELDNSLTFQNLVRALVKFPDREEDLEAYIGTMPMWSSAKEVIAFMLEEEKFSKKLKSKSRAFLAHVARACPWTDASEIRVLGAKVQEVFGTSCILDATEGNALLEMLAAVWPPPVDGANVVAVDRSIILEKIGAFQKEKSGMVVSSGSPSAVLDAMLLEGLLTERGDAIVLPRRTRYRMSKDVINDVPIVRDYIVFTETFSTGFVTVPMQLLPVSDSVTLRVFSVDDVLKVVLENPPPGLNHNGVLAMLHHLVGVGVLAFANARPGAISESSLLYFTRYGIKMQMLTSAHPQSPKRLGGVVGGGDSGTVRLKSLPRIARKPTIGPPPVMESVVSGSEERVDMVEVARQLSIVFQNLYRAIRPTHLLEQRWSRESENNPAFMLFSLIKNLSNLVVRTLLQSPARSESFHRLLVLGSALAELNNFSGAFAVALGVSQHVVTRLELSPLPADEPMLRDLMDLVDSSRNYANYRAKLASVDHHESCVPYLGVVTQAITLIEEGNPTHIRTGEGEKQINRDKVFLMWGVLEAFLAWQDNGYALEAVRQIRKWLVKELIETPPTSEERLYELSYAIKGRPGEPDAAASSSSDKSGYF